MNRIFAAAKNIDDKTMALKYMDALRDIGASPSTKYILPLEMTELAKQLGGFLDRGMDAGTAVRLGTSEPKAEDDA